ncbi:MAG: hypothetical protein ACI4KM_01220 [Oscillospiraceae bacterium]
MEIILKKVGRGFLFGLAGGAAVYIISFVIEFFTFLKEYISNTNLSDEVIAGNAANAGVMDSLNNYTPLLPVWSWIVALLVFGAACFVGVVIGFIIGYLHRADRENKVNNYNMSVLEDGSQRQKIIFAGSIKTMADSLTESCDENLYYMNELVSAQYISGEVNEAIMTELVKFIEYEQTIKDYIETNAKEGGC